MEGFGGLITETSQVQVKAIGNLSVDK